MDSSLKAALAGNPTTFTAVEIILPGSPEVTIRLCSGGFVSFDSMAFDSESDFGTLDTVDVIRDGVESERTTATVALLIADQNAIADILSFETQGAKVRIWEGAVSRTTGVPAGNTAELLFTGFIDNGSLLVGDTVTRVTLNCTTWSEVQQYSGEAWRLSHAFHQSIWPGELGLQFTTRPDRVFWRANGPRTANNIVGGPIGDGFVPGVGGFADIRI